MNNFGGGEKKRGIISELEIFRNLLGESQWHAHNEGKLLYITYVTIAKILLL